MTFKQFLGLCLLWFLFGCLFGGIFIGMYCYHHGQAKAYQYLHDDYEDQQRYDNMFDRTA